MIHFFNAREGALVFNYQPPTPPPDAGDLDSAIIKQALDIIREAGQVDPNVSQSAIILGAAFLILIMVFVLWRIMATMTKIFASHKQVMDDAERRYNRLWERHQELQNHNDMLLNRARTAEKQAGDTQLSIDRDKMVETEQLRLMVTAQQQVIHDQQQIILTYQKGSHHDPPEQILPTAP